MTGLVLFLLEFPTPGRSRTNQSTPTSSTIALPNGRRASSLHCAIDSTAVSHGTTMPGLYLLMLTCNWPRELLSVQVENLRGLVRGS